MLKEKLNTIPPASLSSEKQNIFIEHIHDTCLKLNRPDLVNVIKIAPSKCYHMHLQNNSVFHDIAFCVRRQKKYKITYPKIILTQAFFHLNDNTQLKVIQHEACHIIDGSQENDITIFNGGHGKSFMRLMDILNNTLLTVDNFDTIEPWPALSELILVRSSHYNMFKGYYIKREVANLWMKYM